MRTAAPWDVRARDEHMQMAKEIKISPGWSDEMVGVMVGELKFYGFQPAKLENLYGFEPTKLKLCGF